MNILDVHVHDCMAALESNNFIEFIYSEHYKYESIQTFADKDGN